VGVVLQFDHPVTPQSVEITVPQGAGPMTVEIRTAQGLDPGALADTEVLGSGQVAGGPAAIPVANAPKSPYLLVFLTQIPGSGNTWQARIGEIVVKGN
jgi:putative peptidoglycan lipid II flippase